jgi:uncharacterized damage-inducible protein DinB
MAYPIKIHLQYNTWANSKFAEFLSSIDNGVLDHENSSSFSSIFKTVVHIWDAQVVWYRRLEGVSLRAFPSSSFAGTKKDALEGLVQSSEDFDRFIQLQAPDFLNTMLTYQNIKGDTFTDAVEDILFHVVNHSTYHRGQIITMLREAGVTNLVSTDLILYLRELRK